MKIKDKKIVVGLVVLFVLAINSEKITKWVTSINMPSNQITDIEERNKANLTSKANDFEDPSKNKTLDEWKSINDEVVAKLHFKGKEVPIVQTSDNDKYLHINIYKEKDYYGVPYLDFQNHLDDGNLVVYGHAATKDKLIFTSIKDYLKDDDKSEIKLETASEVIEYVPLAVFDLTNLDENHFMEWYQLDIDDEGTFFEYQDKLIENADVIYNKVASKKRLITLVTCNMEYPDARIVLVCVEK